MLITLYTLIGILMTADGSDVASVEVTKGMPSIEVCEAKMKERAAANEGKEIYMSCIPVTVIRDTKPVTRSKVI